MSDFRGQFTTIKGLSDNRRLPRLGKIRLGRKVVNSPEKIGDKCRCKKPGEPGCYYCTHPEEVDYFICPPEVQAIYGEKPKELDIMMPVNDLNVAIPTAHKWYGKSFGVKCIGNGEIGLRSYGEEGMKEVNCPCEHLKTKTNKKGECQRLAHFLPKLPKVSMGGVYQIDTRSINSIIDIQSGLDFTATMIETVSGIYRFNLIPLILKRVKTITHGSGREEVHYTLNVNPSVDITNLNLLAKNIRRIPSYEVEVPKLTEASDIDYEDEEKELPPDVTIEKRVEHEPIEEVLDLEKDEQEELEKEIADFSGEELPPPAPEEEQSTRVDTEEQSTQVSIDTPEKTKFEKMSDQELRKFVMEAMPSMGYKRWEEILQSILKGKGINTCFADKTGVGRRLVKKVAVALEKETKEK